MDLIIDFLLLATSATACFYCIVLSRRLKGLTGAKEGLGAGIAALSRSAEEVKSAIAGTKSSADAAASRIERLLKEAEAKTRAMQALMDDLNDTSTSVVAEAEAATKKYVDTLAPFLGEANEAASRLLSAIGQASPAPVAAPVSAFAIGAKRRPAPARDIEDDFVSIDDTALREAAKARILRNGAAA